MYYYFINSEPYLNVSLTINTSVLKSLYESCMTSIDSKYNEWLQEQWRNIIIHEQAVGTTCLQNNVLYYNIARSLVWDIIMFKLIVPSSTFEDIYNYYGIKAKAIFLEQYGIDLYDMLEVTDNPIFA